MTTKKKTFETIPVDTKVSWHYRSAIGAVAEVVGIKCGVVSGVLNLESSGVEAVGLETTP